MPSGPGDLKGLKDFKAHLTLAGRQSHGPAAHVFPIRSRAVVGPSDNPPHLRWAFKAWEVHHRQKGHGLLVRI